ncbi:MAG TPA: endonuclease Q family protein [Caldisericia bacterium]|nr:endonuclease Q family protein [Caldisericia bacterium]HQL66467.1 endonuclease Q family protein [Caldisericia bacterium]
MRVISDLHIHSKYSRATSRDMEIPSISKWAKIKGINLVGTGDFTHPDWLREIKSYLKEYEDGIYEYDGVYFILSAEINLIFSFKGKSRKVHICLLAKNFEDVEKLNRAFSEYGELSIDGRPILPLNCIELTKLIKDVTPDTFIYPAHLWTPWFGIFGSVTGFDSLEEAFGNEIKYIHAIETGLSSDPPMNWLVSKLDKFSLLSNSDAHSPAHLGREANVFQIDLNYDELIDSIIKKDKNRFLFTIEFFPEEGKYHFDGHRNCGVSMSPEESIKINNICPNCHKPMTLGVLHRVYDLKDRDKINSDNFIPYKSVIPLMEIISQALEKNENSKVVQDEYSKIIGKFDNEFNVLIFLPIDEMKGKMDDRILKLIKNMREGKVITKPGFDGEFGKIEVVFEKEEEKPPSLF